MENNKVDYLIADTTIIFNIYRLTRSIRALKNRIYNIVMTNELNQIKPLLIYFYVALSETTSREELIKMKEEDQEKLYKDLVIEIADNSKEILDIYSSITRAPYRLNETQILLRAEREYKDLIKSRRN